MHQLALDFGGDDCSNTFTATGHLVGGVRPHLKAICFRRHLDLMSGRGRWGSKSHPSKSKSRAVKGVAPRPLFQLVSNGVKLTSSNNRRNFAKMWREVPHKNPKLPILFRSRVLTSLRRYRRSTRVHVELGKPRRHLFQNVVHHRAQWSQWMSAGTLCSGDT
jgi:hypothetical protein